MKFLISFLLVACLNIQIVYAAHGLSENSYSIDRPDVIVFSKTGSKGMGPIWKNRLEQISNIGIDEFTAHARFHVKTEQKVVPVNVLELSFQDIGFVNVNGWKISRDKQSFEWIGKIDEQKELKLPLRFKSHNNTANHDLNNFDELWLDYSRLNGSEHEKCIPGLSVRGVIEPTKTEVVANTGFIQLGHKELLANSTTPWVERNYGYYLARILNLSPHSTWSYVQHGNDVLLQMRMHQNLSKSLWIDVVLETGSNLKQINFAVKQKSSDLIEVLEIPTPNVNTKGQKVYRIHIGNILSKKYPRGLGVEVQNFNDNPIYLQEIFLFLEGDLAKTVASKPLREIILQDVVNDSIAIPSEIQPVNSETNRMVANLNGIKDVINKYQWFNIKDVQLKLYPPADSDRCRIRIKDVNFIKKGNAEAPVYIRKVEDWTKRLGGPHKQFKQNLNLVEHPGILWFYSKSKDSKGESGRQGQYNILNSSTKNYLKGSSILTWPVNLLVGPETMLYIGVDDVDQTHLLDVVFEDLSGMKTTLNVTTNEAHKISIGKKYIRSISINTDKFLGPPKISIGEVALFEPSVVKYNQALELPLPILVNHTFEHTLAPGLIKEGTLLIDPRIFTFGGLRLSYNLPPTAAGNCIMRFRMNWDYGVIERDFCPSTRIGINVLVPFDALLTEKEIKSNLGKLRSVDWKVSLTTIQNLNNGYAIKLGAEGYANLTAVDELVSNPLFKVNGEDILALNAKGEMHTFGSNVISVSLDPIDILNKMFKGSPVLTNESNYFDLFQIDFTPLTPFNNAEWDKFVLTHIIESNSIIDNPLFLTFIVLSVIAGVVYLRRAYNPQRKWVKTWLEKFGRTNPNFILTFNLAALNVYSFIIKSAGKIMRCKNIKVFAIITVLMYAFGMFFSGLSGNSMLFSTAGLALMMTIRASFLALESHFRRRIPKVATAIYSKDADLFFSVAITSLVGIGFLILAGLERFSSPLALVVFYSMAVGIILKIKKYKDVSKR